MLALVNKKFTWVVCHTNSSFAVLLFLRLYTQQKTGSKYKTKRPLIFILKANFRVAKIFVGIFTGHFIIILRNFRLPMLPKEQTYDERELFALISRSNEQAFAEIYLRYADKLYLHVAKLLKEDSWAEEIVQEVFVKLWQVRDTLGGIANPSAYLYRIAGNRTLDYLKHRAVEVKTQYQIFLFAEPSARNDTQEQLDFRISESLFKQAVKDLTAQKQLIFKLKHEDGQSYEEIARQLQLSKNTVRNHLAEALFTIRAYLLKKGIFLLIFLHCWKGL